MTKETGVTAGAADQAADAAAETITEEMDAAAGGGEEDGARHEESIPYERFKKVNGELELTKKQFNDLQSQFENVKDFLEFIEDLKKDGINNSDDVRKFITNQNLSGLQTKRTAAESKAAQDYHKAVAERPDLQDAAYRAYLIDMKAAEVDFKDGQLKLREAESARSSGGTVDTKIKAALKEFPLADEETLRDLAKVPGTDIVAKAKRLHDKEAERQVEYTKKKAEQTGTKGPATKPGTNAGASSDAPPPNALKDPKGAAKWLEDFKSKAK